MALGTLTIGADPEVFVVDRTTKEFRSAYGLLPGTKKEPYPVKYGAVQIDGMATEFNIDPASTSAEFERNITSVMAQMRKMLPNDVELTDMPTALFDPKYFAAQPEAAREMGCDPDYNAYTGEVNERPTTDKPMRTAGGHIHLGWTKDMDPQDPDHFADCREVVRQLDVYLGVNSMLWDYDNQRRALYGAPGAFRPKSYGVEYRSLSGVWASDPVLRKFVFDASCGAIRDLYNGVAARTFYGATWARDFISQSGNPFSTRAENCIPSFMRNLPFFRDGGVPADFDGYCRNLVGARRLNMAVGGIIPKDFKAGAMKKNIVFDAAHWAHAQPWNRD